MGKSPRKIMIVDDHPLVSRGLMALIDDEKDLRVTATAQNAREAMEKLKAELPDLLILDLSLPGVPGWDLMKNIKVLYPSLRILILTMSPEHIHAERALHSGASGYIMKHEPSEELMAAIRKVLVGEVYVSPAQMERILQKMSANGRNPAERNDVQDLSNRELQVLTLIGEGYTTKETAKRLNLSPKTVQTYRDNLRNKLGLNNSTELAHYAAIWVSQPENQ